MKQFVKRGCEFHRLRGKGLLDATQIAAGKNWLRDDRKITFGHRCLKGGQRMATLMSVAETARRHGHRVSQIFLALMRYPPSQVLRQLYAVA